MLLAEVWKRGKSGSNLPNCQPSHALLLLLHTAADMGCAADVTFTSRSRHGRGLQVEDGGAQHPAAPHLPNLQRRDACEFGVNRLCEGG